MQRMNNQNTTLLNMSGFVTISASKAPFIWIKVVPGKRVTLPAESTSASVYKRKKVDSFARANSTRACSDRLGATELTWTVEPKCLYGEKLARLGG